MLFSITSLIKLRVLEALGRQDVHHAPSFTNGSTPPLAGHEHLLPWNSSIHLYPWDCWLEIPSIGIKAQWMVTNDPEIEEDVLPAKGSHEDDDTSGGESDGTSGTPASTESDADVVPEKRRRGAYHKPRPPRKNNPPAFILLPGVAVKVEEV